MEKKKVGRVVSGDFPSFVNSSPAPKPAGPPPRCFASSRAHFLRGDFSQRPLPPVHHLRRPDARPSFPVVPALFFLFYPARRRSDRWAINELKRPSFFFLVSLWLSSFDALPPASPSPLHHPSRPSRDPHSTDGTFSLSFSSSLPLIFFSLSPSVSHAHTHTHTYSACTFSLSRRLSRFFAFVPLFPPFSALGPLHQHISFSPLALRLLLSVIVLLRLPPPPPATLVLFVPRPTRHSTVGRNGLEAVLLTRFSTLRSSVSLPSAYLTLLLLPSLPPSPFLPFSPPLSLQHRTGHPSLSGFPAGFSVHAHAGRVYASHIHLHACRFRVSRSRIGR